MTTKKEDEIEHLISITTHDNILFFTDKGRVFTTKAWEIPETTRQSKGQALVNILNLEQGEHVLSILALDGQKTKYLIMATALGKIKKTASSQFQNLRSNGLIAIRLVKGDKLVSVQPTSGKDHVLLLTRNGKAIRFPEANVRPMGRATRGVRGIRLEQEDKVIAMEIFSEKQTRPKDRRRKVFRDILTISKNGLGKRTKLHLFPSQRRGGKGVKAAVVNDKTGKLISAIMVNQKIEQIIITSKSGQIIKLPLKNIPQLGRATQGVILMRFKNKSDGVAAVATLEKNS